MAGEQVSALRLTLHGQLVGYVAGYAHNRTVLSLAPSFVADDNRPSLTLSLANPATFAARASKIFPVATNMQLHPLLSNLLPEGALRQLLAQRLKIHEHNEFPLLVHLGGDLPGALVAEPVAAEAIPDMAFGDRGRLDRVAVDAVDRVAHFSLAGVQMKFSMHQRDGRYQLGDAAAPGDWIIKTPSTVHAHVPLNEYTSMQLAALAGVDLPETRLVELDKLERLPEIKLPDEGYAYAIRRFDRAEGKRVHAEDFAQVLFAYAADKYQKASYEQIARLIYQNSYNGQRDVVQMAVRLLVNILLGNGDAHLKNWSMLYADGVNPMLSPAYDILFTKAYIPAEQHYALNMAQTKQWYEVSLEHFGRWARRAGLPRSPILYNLKAALDKARALWPAALHDSPMHEAHKAALREHWRTLHSDFRISS